MSAALPLRALLRREVVTQLRRVRSFVIIVIVMLILVWVVAAAWPAGQTLVWSLLPSISTGLLTSIVFCLLAGAGLFVPGVAATTIVSEREQQSWELLALTQLRPSGIVVGKALSAVGMYLILVVALFPVFGSLYFLVGIDWAQLVVSLSLVLVTALTCGMAGVASSAWMRRSGSAVAWAYAGMIFISGLPVTLAGALLHSISLLVFDRPLPYLEVVYMVTSPFPVIMASTLGQFTTFGSVWTLYGAQVGYQALLIGLFFLLALWGVRRRKSFVQFGGIATATVARAGAGPPTLASRRVRVPLRQRLRERRWRRRKPRPPIPDGRNPMAVREIWWGSVGSRRGIRGAGLLMLGASLVLWFAAETLGGSATDALGAAVVLHGVMAVVFTAGAAAGVFTKEHEQRGMDMLRITLLTPSEVVRGKYVAGLRFAFIVSFLSVPANALLYYRVLSDGDPIGFFLAGQGTVIVCALLAASLAMAVSVLAKRTATAVVGGFLAVAAALFGAPLLLWSIAVSLDSGRVWALEFLLGVSSPVVGFFYLAEEYGRQPGVGIDWRFPLLWSLNCFEFLVVAFGAYVFASNCYARLRAQDR